MMSHIEDNKFLLGINKLVESGSNSNYFINLTNLLTGMLHVTMSKKSDLNTVRSKIVNNKGVRSTFQDTMKRRIADESEDGLYLKARFCGGHDDKQKSQ